MLKIILLFPLNTTAEKREFNALLFLGATFDRVNCKPNEEMSLTIIQSKKSNAWGFAWGSMGVIESDWQVKHTFKFITGYCYIGYADCRWLESICPLLIFPMVFTLQRRSCPLTVIVSGLTMKDWSFAAGSCSVAGDGMRSLVVALVHSAVGGRMGSVVAAPIHSVRESIGSLVEEIVRFFEFSSDSNI